MAANNVCPQGNVTLLVDSGGGLTLLNSDWPLEALARERGARAAYRVHDRAGRLFVEGRAGAHACLLSAAPPEQAARALRHFQSSVPAPLLTQPAAESSSCGPNLLL